MKVRVRHVEVMFSCEVHHDVDVWLFGLTVDFLFACGSCVGFVAVIPR